MSNFISFSAGAAIAVLSGMGVGSGGLLVVYLTLVLGYSQQAAQALNLFFFLFAAGASTSVNIRKRDIAWGTVLLMGIFGAFGAITGSLTASFARPRVLRILFGLMLTYTGFSGFSASFKQKKRLSR